MDAAGEAAKWDEVDEAAIEQAWDERRHAREQAERIVPSADLFADGPWIGEQVIYQEGHEVEAARTRGRVHGFEFVRQCWDELVQAGVNPAIIGREIVSPWLDRVAEWLARDIDPERIYLPPRPDDCLTERQRRMLDQAKRASLPATQTSRTRSCKAWSASLANRSNGCGPDVFHWES